MTNLASNLADTAHAHPDRAAVRVADAATTYRELDEASARAAGLLRERGTKPGDRVGIMLPNVAEFPMVYYGILRAGGVVVPMNPLLKAGEVAYYLGDSGARLIFAWHPLAREASDGAGQADAEAVIVEPAGFPNLLATVVPAYQLADRDDQDTAVILYTSGTTGQPKGAELTHANLASNAGAVRADIIRPGPDDVIFGGLPLFHAFGQTCTLNVAVSSGTCLTMLPRFTVDQALQVFADHRVTVFAGVPTMYIEILGHGDHAGYDAGLRMCISGVRRCRSPCCAILNVPLTARYLRDTGCRRRRQSPHSTSPSRRNPAP